MAIDRPVAEFCERLHSLNLPAWKQALAILWFIDNADPDVAATSGELARIMHESGLGTANSTALRNAIERSKLALVSGTSIRLKHLSRDTVRSWIGPALDSGPRIDHASGYIPEAIWRPSRGYIECVAVQMNACFKFGYYDAASVMLRRLVETLIIEAYETLNRQDEIKGAGGHYHMLGDLVDRVNSSSGLQLGRDAKAALTKIKEQGDRAAHNRRFNAVKSDLTGFQSAARVAIQELVHLADFRRKTS